MLEFPESTLKTCNTQQIPNYYLITLATYCCKDAEYGKDTHLPNQKKD